MKIQRFKLFILSIHIYYNQLQYIDFLIKNKYKIINIY